MSSVLQLSFICDDALVLWSAQFHHFVCLVVPVFILISPWTGLFNLCVRVGVRVLGGGGVYLINESNKHNF